MTLIIKGQNGTCFNCDPFVSIPNEPFDSACGGLFQVRAIFNGGNRTTRLRCINPSVAGIGTASDSGGFCSDDVATLAATGYWLNQTQGGALPNPACAGGGSAFSSAVLENDVIQARKDAVWSSSFTFDVHCYYIGGVGTPPTSAYIACGWNLGSTPYITATQCKAFTPPSLGTSCNTNFVTTVTVNDDGTFSLS